MRVMNLIPQRLFPLAIPLLISQRLAVAEPAQVVVSSTRPGVVDVLEMRGTVSTNVREFAGVRTTTTTERVGNHCKVPCSFTAEAGPIDLRIAGDGYSGAQETFALHPGENLFVVKPGKLAAAMGGYLLVVFGVLTLAGAAVVAIRGSETERDFTGMEVEKPAHVAPWLITGLILTGAGIPLGIIGHTSFEQQK